MFFCHVCETLTMPEEHVFKVDTNRRPRRRCQHHRYIPLHSTAPSYQAMPPRVALTLPVLKSRRRQSSLLSPIPVYLQPTNPYAATKAAAEFLVKSYHRSFNLPVPAPPPPLAPLFLPLSCEAVSE